MVVKECPRRGRCWQELEELGVGAPRCQVKERLRSVWEGASRGKERGARANEAARG
jgi:hypothetical protein